MLLKNIKFFFYLLHVCGYFIQDSYAQYREGDRCVRQHDNSYGTCKLLRQCPKVVDDYSKYQIAPQYCQFDINTQIVCCPNINLSENDVRRQKSFDDYKTTTPSLDTLIQDTFNRQTTKTESPYYSGSNSNTAHGNVNNYEYTSSTQRNLRTNDNHNDGLLNSNSWSSNGPYNERKTQKSGNTDDLIDTAFVGNPIKVSSSTQRQRRTNRDRISVQKCEDYKKLSKKIILFSPLLVDPTPIRKEVPLCDATTPLIVGGDTAKPGEFPSMAALGQKTDENDDIQWYCGGTLISERFVVTAAHCVKKSRDKTVVRLGEQNLATVNDGVKAVDYGIEQVYIHPNYKISSSYYDIALIRLDKDVEFTSNIRPTCLWQSDNINASRAIAAGWGSTEFMFERSDNLLKVDLNFYTNDNCQHYYSAPNNRKLINGIVNEQLCAGSPDKEKDTCQGDSGGPLFVIFPDNPCVHHLVGITSFGSFCGGAAPGVYTRISSYIDWIESIVW